MDTRYVILIGVLLIVIACGGAYAGLFSRGGRLERRRYFRFVAVFLFVLPAIYSVMLAIQGIVQSGVTMPPAASWLTVLSQVPLFLGALFYMMALSCIVGAVLASPFTLTISLILAPVSKRLLRDGKPAEAGMPRMLAMDGIAFVAGAIANGLMMGGLFDQGFVPPVEIGSLSISVLEGGLASVICNRLACAWVRRASHPPAGISGAITP